MLKPLAMVHTTVEYTTRRNSQTTQMSSVYRSYTRIIFAINFTSLNSATCWVVNIEKTLLPDLRTFLDELLRLLCLVLEWEGGASGSGAGAGASSGASFGSSFFTFFFFTFSLSACNQNNLYKHFSL